MPPAATSIGPFTSGGSGRPVPPSAWICHPRPSRGASCPSSAAAPVRTEDRRPGIHSSSPVEGETVGETVVHTEHARCCFRRRSRRLQWRPTLRFRRGCGRGLGCIQGAISLANQLFAVAGVIGEGGDAEAGGERPDARYFGAGDREREASRPPLLRSPDRCRAGERGTPRRRSVRRSRSCAALR